MADILTQLQTCLDQVLSRSHTLHQAPGRKKLTDRQLATQFYATLGYLSTYHDNSPATPPDVPSAAPALARMPKNSTAPPVPASVAATSQASPQRTSAPPETPAGGGGGGGGTGTGAEEIVPDSPRTFASRQRELARDLVIKEQQIEYLISVLPGIGSSEKEQEGRIRELEGELRAVEDERQRKVRELRVLRRKLEGVLGGVEMGIYGQSV